MQIEYEALEVALLFSERTQFSSEAALNCLERAQLSLAAALNATVAVWTCSPQASNIKICIVSAIGTIDGWLKNQRVNINTKIDNT